MTVCKSPQEQAELDAMFKTRNEMNDSLIRLLWSIIESPNPNPHMGVHTELDRVNYMRQSMIAYRKRLEKMFTEHERKFP
jgi:hypothetical protein